jgi:hypothetical protein
MVVKNKSAYNIFYNEEKLIVTEEYPDLKPMEIAEIVRENWRSVKNDKDLLKKYTNLAEIDKKRYEMEVEEEKKLVNMPIPKKYTNSYVFFCQSAKPLLTKKYPTLAKSEIMEKVRELWRETKNDKIKLKKYIEMATHDKKRYEDELKIYNEYLKNAKQKLFEPKEKPEDSEDEKHEENKSEDEKLDEIKPDENISPKPKIKKRIFPKFGKYPSPALDPYKTKFVPLLGWLA